MDKSTTNCHFAASPTGWTNDAIALYYMDKVFEPATKAKAGRSRRLLILDGHGSHINMAFLEWCHSHKVIVIAFPPHTTHCLQPLDVSLFSPLATRYSQHLDRYIHSSLGISSVRKADFFRIFWSAWQEASTEANVLSGFKKTSISPFDPSLVVERLPSQPSTRPSTSGTSNASSLVKKAKKTVQIIETAANDHRRNQVPIKSEDLLQMKNSLEELSIEFALQRQQLTGLIQALYQEKRKKIKKKTLCQGMRAKRNNRALIFSPAGVQLMREEAASIEADKAATKQLLEQARTERAIQKDQEQQLKEQRAQERKNNQHLKVKSQAAAALQRLHQKETVQSSRQLNVELQTTAKASKKTNNTFKNTSTMDNPSPLASRSQKPLKSAGVGDLKTTRSGRPIKPSQRSLN